MKKNIIIGSLLLTSVLSFSHAAENIAKIQSTKKSQRIVGGNTVSNNDDTWRFIVALKNQNNFQFCAGSLISPDWVLTAAHCVTGRSPSEIKIGMGNYDKTQLTPHTIDRIVIHESYSGDDSNNDIALIKLSQPENGINHINYDTSLIPTQDGTPSQTAGWGNQTMNGHDASNNLLEVLVPIIDRDTCNIADAYNGRVTENMLCAGYMAGKKDSCQGDSGGPLIVENKLIGIVSWGDGCAEENAPGVYTNVKKYAEWISNHMDEGEHSTTNVWESQPRPYGNNTHLTQEICTDESAPYNVTINGETEAGYDFVTITNANANIVYSESGLHNGTITNVGSNCVTAELISDSSITKEGVTITITGGTTSTEQTDTWESQPRPYGNNTHLTQEICSLETSPTNEYTVTIIGETETNYDFVNIINTSGNSANQVYHESGIQDNTIDVSSHCVTAELISDGSITKEGVVVTITQKAHPMHPVETWESQPRPYENNMHLTHELCIEDAYFITVHIQGETEENYDFVNIIDENNDQLYHESGVQDNEIFVEGSCITVELNSDGSITKEGIIVTVEESLIGT